MNSEDFPQRERLPTPIGWSDTDWIKHLEEWGKHDQEQPHPMAGLHINQGSMDAAADAYEAEYNKAHEIVPEPPSALASSPFAFLLSHPPTPLSAVPDPDPASLPAEPPSEPLPQYRRGLRAETIARYFEAFRAIPPPITGTVIAHHLSYGVSSVLEALRILERAGYVSPHGTKKIPGRRPVIVWTWIGPEPKHGAPSAPRTTT